MGLCQHVYRRGGVYWWRRRVNLIANGERAYLHLSLRVRDPARARVLALRVGAEADRLSLSARTQKLDGAQQVQLLKRFITDQLIEADAVAVANTAKPLLDYEGREAADWNGRPLDALGAHRRAERQLCIVFNALAAGGAAARIRPEDETALLGQGFSAEEIYFARVLLAEMVRYWPALVRAATLMDSERSAPITPSSNARCAKQASSRIRAGSGTPAVCGCGRRRMFWPTPTSAVRLPTTTRLPRRCGPSTTSVGTRSSRPRLGPRPSSRPPHQARQRRRSLRWSRRLLQPPCPARHSSPHPSSSHPARTAPFRAGWPR